MSYSVSQSTPQLGLRIALGADASDLMRLVVLQGLALTGSGIVLGAVAALGLTRLLGHLLYRVSPHDPVTFGSALAGMTIAALVACLIPALRNADLPVRALRT